MTIEVISPELVLVDPELARLARERLPDPGWLSAPGRFDSVAAEKPLERPQAAAIASPAASTERAARASRSELRSWARRTLLIGACYLAVPAIAVGALTYARDIYVTDRPSLQPVRDAAMTPPRADAARSSARRAAVQDDDSPGRAGAPDPSLSRTPVGISKPASRRQEPPESPTGTRSIDRDGQAAPAVESSRSALPKKPPATAATAATAPTVLVWPRAEGAVAYRVTLFRSRSKIFERVTRTARVEIPSTLLEPGLYRWTVWRLTRGRSAAADEAPVVDSTWLYRG
jgi:hypothetical protein